MRGGGGMLIYHIPCYIITLLYHLAPGGRGGGHSQYILVGVCRGTLKRGVLGTGRTPKRWVLGTGTTQKWGLRQGAGGGGVLRTGLVVKKPILVTDVAQRGVLGAYLLITFTFFLST